MTRDEFDAWWRVAPPESARTVAHAARAAMEDWHGRLAYVVERADAEVASGTARLCPVGAAQAAARCAAELEVLVQVWPTRPDVALRPGRPASGRAVR